MEKILEGYRILVTRAAHQASQLADALEDAGAETISIPAIEITGPRDEAPLHMALQRAGEFDWMVLTSANAVEAVMQRKRVKELAHLKIAAIGPATARTAQAAGLKISLTPPEAVAESLALALAPLVRGKKVLLPQAAAAREVLAESLRCSGATVTAVEAYRSTVPAVSAVKLREAFAREDAVPHAIAFTSSSTAQHFFALLAAADVAMPEEMVLASIGPITSQTLRGLGHEPHVEAAEHTVPGLVRAIEHHFVRHDS